MKSAFVLLIIAVGLPAYAGNLSCESSTPYSVYYYCGTPDAPKTCKSKKMPRYAEIVKVAGSRPLWAATLKCKPMKAAPTSNGTENFRRIAVCREISRPLDLPLDLPSKFGLELKRAQGSAPQTQTIVYDESSEQDAIPLATLPCNLN